MKICIRHYRVAVVHEEHVRAIVSCDQETHKDQVMAAIKDEYGPLLPGMTFFWPGGHTVLIGIPYLSFDIPEANIPTAGLVLADPTDSVKTHRLDGQLFGELSRLGIHTVPEKYETRCSFEVRGN